MNVTAQVTVAGKKPDLRLDSFHITQELYGHSEMWVRWGTEHDEENDLSKQLDNFLDKEIEIKIENKSVSKIFRGKILGLNTDVNQIECYAISESFLLDSVPMNRGFVEKSVIQIVKKIVDDAGVRDKEVKGPKSSLNFKYMAQYQETDYAFLRKLANYDGCVFYHDGEKLIYSPKIANGSEITLNPEDVVSVQSSMTSRLLPTQARGAPHNYKPYKEPFQGNSVVKVTARLSGSDALFKKVFSKAEQVFGSDYVSYDDDVIDERDFRQWLENQVNLTSGNMLVVSASSVRPEIAVGSSVKFKGQNLEGPFFVTHLTLSYDESQFQNNFQAVPAELVRQSSPAFINRKLSSVQVAIVTDNKDPDKLGRVKVRFPWDDKGDACPWVRVVSAAAGKEQKAFFIPKKDDNVLVAFEKGDPSAPVILGALYHDDNKPKFVTDNGTEEVLLARTKNGSLIHLIDKDNEQEIIISMQEGKNLIKLKLGSTPEVIIETAGKLSIKGKEVRIEGTDKLHLEGKEFSAESDKMKLVGRSRIDLN